MKLRCEVCELDSTQTKLYTCGSLDIPMEHYCLDHYYEHLREAHHGIPLPGCADLADAKRAKAGEGK